MKGQNFGEHFNASGFVEENDKDTNSPVENSNPHTGKIPVFAALIQQTPVNSGTVTADSAMSESIVQEAPGGETIIYNKDSMGETLAHEASSGVNADSAMNLLSHAEAERFRVHWNEIQGQFVDEPRSAVKQADALVCEVIEKITQLFANEQSSLEDQWNQGNEVSTEDLRQTMQHYRAFFNRLLVEIPS